MHVLSKPGKQMFVHQEHSCWSRPFLRSPSFWGIGACTGCLALVQHLSVYLQPHSSLHRA